MQAPAVSTERIEAQDTEVMIDSTQEKCIDCPERQDHECQARTVMTLSDYKPGQKGKVIQVCGNTDFRRRMMEMGFVKGAKVSVVKYAPLNDPMELVLMGYHLSIRRGEAADILMNEPEKAA
jgi:ferrous iron transport protein A